MFPPIVTSNEPSIYAVHHSRPFPARLLTTDHVIRHSHINVQDSGGNSRIMGNLSWLENEQIASLNSRIEFINKTISSITEAVPLRETPITLVSLGSGGLLMEYFIHQQLKQSGYQYINWRIIDADYQNGGYENTRKEFREQVDDKVKAFTAEQSYLNKRSEEGSEKLAVSDKHRGAVVILSINPPTILYSEAPIGSTYITFRGNAVKDASKANAIYLMVANYYQKEFVDKAMSQLYSEVQVIASECILKYSINRQGLYEVGSSDSSVSEFIKGGAEVYLNPLNMRNNNTKLTDINQALDKYIKNLPKTGAYGNKIFVSDYDQSIIELKNFFIDSHNKTLFLSLDKNNISIQR